jgi:hypothetical protein
VAIPRAPTTPDVAIATAPTASLVTPAPDASDPAVALPQAAHAVSLGDPPIIPKGWLVKAGIATGAMLLIGTVAAVWSSAARTSGPPIVEPDAGVAVPDKASEKASDKASEKAIDKPKPRPKAAEIEPPSPSPAPELHTLEPTTPPPDDAAFRDAIDKLWKGKSCTERRAAVTLLSSLGDARAIPELTKARHWWHNKNWGLRHDDWNACLTADADAAIKNLSPR